MTDDIQPGDVRVDNLAPDREIYIVFFVDYGEDGKQEWYETNIGTIEKTRIGNLIRRERVADWAWVGERR